MIEFRKIILFFLIIFSWNNTFSQNNRKQKYIDRYHTATSYAEKLKWLDSICYFQNDSDNYLLEYYQLSQKYGSSQSKFRAVKRLSNYYFNLGKYDQAIAVMEPVISDFKKHHEDVYLYRSYNQLGKIYNRIDQYLQAEKFYKKALSIYNHLPKKLQNKNKKTLAILYARMGILYKNMQKNTLADEYDLKSFEISKQLNDYMRISHFYASQGWIYTLSNNYDSAEKYFRLAIKDSAKIKYRIYVIAGMHGLGYVLGEKGKYKEALYYDSIALNYFKKDNNKLFTNTLLNNIAKVYLYQKDYAKALANINEAVMVAKEANLPKSLYLSKIILAKIYAGQGNYLKAKRVLDSIDYKSNYFYKLGVLQKKDFFDILYNVNFKLKNYQEAERNFQLLSLYQDSLQYKRLKNFSDIDNKYRSIVNKKKLQQKEYEVQLAHKQQQLFIIVLLFIVFVLFAVFYYLYVLYKRYKQNKTLLSQTVEEIKKLKAQLLQTENGFSNEKMDNFRSFLMQKYQIDKKHIIEVWESIAMGESRYEFVDRTKISENTVKKYRSELYGKIKSKLAIPDKRLGDYKVAIEYYKSLIEFKDI